MASVEHSGRSRRVGPVVTISTVVAVLAATCLTLFGLGAFDRAVAVYEPNNWLFSRSKGELSRVNGNTAKVDTRVKVAGTNGHDVEVSQSDRYLVVRDKATGTVSALDLTTLQIAATMDTQPGEGVRVVVGTHSAYVIDPVQGVVREIDPLTLSPIGEPVNFAPNLRGGAIDNDGKLWLALPDEGTVVSVTPADKPTGAPAVHTESIAEPRHDLSVSVLDKGVAVLDQTADQLVTVRGAKVTRTALHLEDQATVAARTSGDKVPVTIPDALQVAAVGDNSVNDLNVPAGSGDGLQPAVAWAGWFYVPDNKAGVVYVLNDQGTLADVMRFPNPTNDIELQVKDDYLYVNAVDTGTAKVVDKNHKVNQVDKFPTDVPGADPLPPPPPPPNPPPPPVGPPGAPTSVVAAAGNATAHLTWGAAPSNGSPILKYVVDGNGTTTEVGADQRALDITGLTNGTTYTFSVHAVNAKGSGPKRNSNPVVPTSDVPDPPTNVTAQALKDGTVEVSWSAANGQGHQVASYQVTATGPKGAVKTWQVDGAQTKLSAPAQPDLAYGTQYAFTVTTINDKGAASKASALSPSIVPFTVPGAPQSLRATTGTKAGVVHVAWAAAVSNGQPITKYVVSYGGKSVDVTSGTQVDLTGLTDGQSVTVTVVAENAAGQGAKAGPVTAKTIANPTVTVSKVSVDFNSVAVSFTTNDGGGSNTCKLAVGGNSASGACTGITIGSLAPGLSYNYTVTVTNQAGSATATGSATTKALMGKVGCVSTNGYCDSGVGIYDAPWQDSSAETSWNGHNGTQYQAYCKVTGKDGNQQASATLHAAGYNNNKVSDQWIRITAPSDSTNRYIPWVWFNMNPDDLSLLPVC
jgi:hypothetical protein